MPDPAPIPDELGAAFSTAQARRLETPSHRLRGGDLVAPYRGTRVRRDADSWAQRLRALTTVLPSGACFSHDTAARLWRLPLPLALQEQDTVHVTVPAAQAQPRRSGVVGHRAVREPVDLRGLPVTTLADTWCDLASRLDLLDLVIAGDALVNRQADSFEDPFAVDDLRLAWHRLGLRRHARLAREAMDLVRPGSASPQETRARVFFHQWGLPEPEPNVKLQSSTGWVATVDFLWREQRVVGEYHGASHGASWRADYRRQATIGDLGLTVVVMTAYDLAEGAPALRERLNRLLLP